MAFAALVVLGYLLGSCPWGYWLVRLVKHEDIRTVGSGNIGATNVWRTYGRWLGAPGRPARRAEGVRARRCSACCFVLAAPSVRDHRPARRRCSATGVRCSCASRRAARWSRPAAASSSASRVWVALTAGVVWLDRVPGAALRLARLDRRAGSRFRSAPTCYGYPTSVVLFGAAAAAAILFLHRGEPGAPAGGDREPLPLPPRRAPSFPPKTRLRCARMRKGLLLVVLAVRSGCAPGALAAGWCGGSTEAAADRPDVRHRPAGARGRRDPVRRRRHRSRPTSAALADDIASISAWWQGQDPTRIPRFDQAAFGAAHLPRHLVRAPRRSSGATYTASGASGAFQRDQQRARARRARQLVQEVPRLLRRPVGAGERLRRRAAATSTPGRSYAIIWLQECPDVPSDTIAAHELLHALGALPDGRPASVPADRRRQRPSVRQPDRHPLPVRLGRPAHARSCSTSTTTTTTAHPDRIRGWTSRTRSGCTGSIVGQEPLARLVQRRPGHDHERRAGRRLHGDVHDAVGPGRRR